MEVLTGIFKQVQPEAVVIVGNDQREFFGPDLTPAITVFTAKRSTTCSICTKDRRA